MNKTITLFMLMLFASVSAFAQISDAKKKEIESQYDHVYWFTLSDEGYFTVKKNGKEGAFDKNGKMIIPCLYDNINQHDNRYYSVKLNGKEGIFDLKGKMLVDFKYTDVSWHMTEDYIGCEVELDGKKGFISSNGNIMVPCEYEDITYFPKSEKDIYAEVKKNGYKGVYDVCKKALIVPCEFESADYDPKYEKDYGAKVYKEEKCGIYDIHEKTLIIPCEYTYIAWWMAEKHQGCDVEIDGKKGYINLKGDVIIPCEYDAIGYYPKSSKDYLATIEKNKLKGIFDVRKGKEVVPCTYTYISIVDSVKKAIVCNGGIFNSHELSFTKNGKWGCIDLESSRVVIPCEYDFISYAGENLFKVNKGREESYKLTSDPIGGVWGVVDANNKVVFKTEYTQIGNFKDGVAQAIKDNVATILVNPQKGTNMLITNGVNSNTIDQNIPQTGKQNENAFAFIFANENYKNGANADFSINDGKIFAKYCQQTLGLPENNVKYYEDATFGNFQSALKKVKDIADVYDGEAKIIFYYSGLGNTVDGKRYILPSDVSLASTKVTAISIDNILSTLNALNTTYTLALFDAPFNGTDKSGKMLETARGVKVKSKAPTTTGKVVAVFGSSDDKNNYAYKKCAHGLFTYNLLEQLQQSKGNGAWKSLIENANSKVDKDALKEFNDIQKPQIIVSDIIRNNWENLKF